MNKLYSTKELVKMLKITTKRPTTSCLLLIRRIEESKNITILQKIGSQYYVPENVLKSVLPQLFEEDKITEQSLPKLRETVMLLTQKINSLTVRIQELEEKLETK